ncbi:MAG: cytochrome b, partial [Burkholderiales bacterium]
MEQHRAARYGSVAQFFHWATAILVLVAFIYGPGGSELRVYSPAGDFDRRLHEALGMCVFALVIMRLAWRAVDARPPSAQVLPWMHIAAKAVHWGLYLLLFALPITAISGAWLEGHPVTFLGGVEVEPLLGPSHDLGVQIARIHVWLGNAILWLAGSHALAALCHHMVTKDDVLVSMLPRGCPCG